ncbi:MAG: hypothetical protein IJF84_03185 [Thermoguttaceae bacterium]|nr:hypothetical protein [Thermoguttaceae bacterium]
MRHFSISNFGAVYFAGCGFFRFRNFPHFRTAFRRQPERASEAGSVLVAGSGLLKLVPLLLSIGQT